MSKLSTKPFVKLRVYKGIEKLTNSKGVVINENQLVTLEWNTIEWANYFKFVGASGFGIIEVEQCFDEKGVDAIDTPQEITDFVANVFKTPEKELTAEQKQILELQKQVEALLKSNKEPKVTKEKADTKTPPSEAVETKQ